MFLDTEWLADFTFSVLSENTEITPLWRFLKVFG